MFSLYELHFCLVLKAFEIVLGRSELKCAPQPLLTRETSQSNRSNDGVIWIVRRRLTTQEDFVISTTALEYIIEA